MLTTLRVKNLALVKALRLEFGQGLNIITGETGAGKSVMIGALGLLLGERADRSLIRSGEDACGAEAVFQLEDTSEVDEILESFGLDLCEEGQLVIRRIIRASGSNQNLVNDNAVTVQVLKQLGEVLVDMHGPHDHQSLLHRDAQLDILDAYGHLWQDRLDYEETYRAWRGLFDRLEELEGDAGTVAEQIDMLSFRIDEIEKAELKLGEEDEIRKEHAMLGNAQRIQELAGGVLNALGEGDENAFAAVAAARRAMDELCRLLPDAEAWREQADGIATQIQDLNTDILRTVEGVDGSPVRLEWLDNRLATYQKMKRKYGGTVEEILASLEESKARLHDLETREEQVEELKKEIANAEAEVQQKGKALRASRKSIGKKLGKAIESELDALGLKNASFTIAFDACDPQASGLDVVEFEFAPNVGEPKRPLRAIASSGEISRVMLATKTALADHDRVPVLVFDEIDTNIGGETGDAVGQKLHEVSLRHQVICITHLPQVAVYGCRHFAVSKSVEDERTMTQVEQLAPDARVEEVARMLGGRDMTSVTLDHAREMLEAAGAC
jgi:DNA repair protein RecN (Recombination protein N)